MTAILRIRPRSRHLAWLPAALLIAAGILSALGLPLIPNTHAVTSDIEISAEVLPEVSLDLGQNASGAATCAGANGTSGITGSVPNEDATFGANVAGQRVAIPASGAFTVGTCSMTFGTNNGTGGASLAVANERTAGAILCKSAQNNPCVLESYTDDDGTNSTLEADKFGMRLLGPATTPVGASACDNFAWTVGNYYGAANAPGSTNICTNEGMHATAANDGVAVVSFEVNTSTKSSGNYFATLLFTATAT